MKHFVEVFTLQMSVHLTDRKNSVCTIDLFQEKRANVNIMFSSLWWDGGICHDLIEAVTCSCVVCDLLAGGSVCSGVSLGQGHSAASSSQARLKQMAGCLANTYTLLRLWNLNETNGKA